MGMRNEADEAVALLVAARHGRAGPREAIAAMNKAGMRDAACYVERMTFPKWGSVSDCRRAYDKHVAAQRAPT